MVEEKEMEACCGVKRFLLLPWSIYAILLPLALFHLYNFFPDPVPLSQKQSISLSNSQQQSINLTSSSDHDENGGGVECNYSNGTWVPEKGEPLYSGTSCRSTISYGQNCMINGRPDSEYLNWRWEPQPQCRLPPVFSPRDFLSLARNKHLAFVGDSLSRNQLESLICMLSSFTLPNLVYDIHNALKFRRWNFPSHNLTISSYWSPFLVKAIEKNASKYYSELFLESVDQRWASELDQFDMVLFTAGQWLVTPAAYFYNGSAMGCHLVKNCTEVGFYDAFGKMLKTTLDAVIGTGHPLDVIVTTFPPAHFEGEWDKFGACPRTRPYGEGEKELDGMNMEMWRTEMGEIEAAKSRVVGSEIRLEAVDITRLAWMRPDAHPGPYMNMNPFANGRKDRVGNDCVHWCLPGPIDTWNLILLETIKRTMKPWDHHQILKH